MIDIKKTNWGVANTYKTNNGYIIEINEKLDDFQNLKDKILKHEFEHAKVKEKGLKGFTKQRKIDALTEVRFRDLIPFYKKYPKTLIQQYLPITYSKGIITFEWSLIFLYLLGIGILSLIYWLINLFSDNTQFFWKVISNIFWIGLVVTILYVLGKYLRKYINQQADKEVTKK